MSTTAELTTQWQTRAGDGSAANWASTWLRHRAIAVTAVAAFQPESVLEIGCRAGPNLRLLAVALPEAHLLGLDVHQPALDYLQAGATREGWADRLLLHCAALQDWLPLVATASVDVILTCYTLAYVAPEDLDPVLRHLQRIAAKGVVLAEPASLTGTSMALSVPSASVPAWAHAYLDRVGAGAGPIVSRPVVPPVDGLNACLTIPTRSA